MAPRVGQTSTEQRRAELERIAAQQEEQRAAAARVEAPGLREAMSRTSGSTSGPQQGLAPTTTAGWQEARDIGFRGTIGGWGERANPTDHDDGLAIDLMTSDRTVGNALADHYIQNAERLGTKYVIWNGQIAEAANGWQWKQYNGSSPHTDHVHVSFFGDASEAQGPGSDYTSPTGGDTSGSGSVGGGGVESGGPSGSSVEAGSSDGDSYESYSADVFRSALADALGGISMADMAALLGVSMQALMAMTPAQLKEAVKAAERSETNPQGAIPPGQANQIIAAAEAGDAYTPPAGEGPVAMPASFADSVAPAGPAAVPGVATVSVSSLSSSAGVPMTA